jgi:hypothetical protein
MLRPSEPGNMLQLDPGTRARMRQIPLSESKILIMQVRRLSPCVLSS